MIKRKTPPYTGTKADPYTTQAQITRLLEEYGCEGVQWTQNFSQNQVELKFIVEVEIKGIRKKIGIQTSPPPFFNKRRSWDSSQGRSITVNAPNWAQSYRLLYWYLKTKLEAIAYGLTTAEKEFFAEVMIKLPTGETGTVFDALGSRALALPEPESPSNTVVTGKIIDVGP